MTLLLWLSSLALAGDPAIHESAATVILDDTTVAGTVTVRAPREDVLALVRNPQLTREASQADLLVEALGPDGACQLFSWTIHTLVASVSYVGRMCEAPDGASVTLVQSRDFDRFSSKWEVTEADAGRVNLTYSTDSQTSLPIPAAITRLQTRREIERTLDHMKRWLEARTDR